ncbi:hypothetical protein BgiMline_029216 [Biomphalaria glabrata]|nr:hypothetical protein BgiMline_025841 [Biomphalaria glabrata]
MVVKLSLLFPQSLDTQPHVPTSPFFIPRLPQSGLRLDHIPVLKGKTVVNKRVQPTEPDGGVITSNLIRGSHCKQTEVTPDSSHPVVP